MEKFRFCLWAWVLLLGIWQPASAQPHLIVSGKGAAAGSPSATMSVDLGAYAVQWSAPTPWMMPTVTADGRYLVAFVEPHASPDSQLWLLDRVSGVVSTIPLGAYVPRELKAHPRRFELYALMTDGTVASITTAGVREIYECTTPGGLDLSGDGARLALVCENDIVVLDATSGSLITRFTPIGSSLPGYDPNPRSPTLNFDGSRVMLVVHFVVPPIDDLAVYDVAPAKLVAHHISPPIGGLSGEEVTAVVAATPSRDAVLVTTSFFFIPGNYGHRSLLVDFSTLAVRQRMPLDGSGGCHIGVTNWYCQAPSTGAFTPDGRHVVVGSLDRAAFPSPRAWLEIAAVGSNTLVASTGPDFFASGGVSIALANAPLAPAGATARVTGRDVTLSWCLLPTSPAVTGYVIEAGSAPGLANLAVLNVDGDQPALTVPGVPPGRYYVRVRARNVTGTSGVSNEMVVDVP